MKIVMTKYGNSLIPSTAIDCDLFDKIEADRDVAVTVTQSRNLQQHKLAWSLVNLCYQHQSLYSTPEKLMDGIKMSIGHTEEVRDVDGNTSFKPASISFEKLSQPEFRMFFDRMLDLIITKIIPGVGREDFENQVYHMLGEPAPSDLRRPPNPQPQGDHDAGRH
jgi:hypothetical protein